MGRELTVGERGELIVELGRNGQDRVGPAHMSGSGFQGKRYNSCPETTVHKKTCGQRQGN